MNQTVLWPEKACLTKTDYNDVVQTACLMYCNSHHGVGYQCHLV